MHIWTGIILFLAGGWLMYTALTQCLRVLQARRSQTDHADGDGTAKLHPSLTMLRDAVPPIVTLALVFVGVMVSIAYVALEAGRVFTIFDLTGFLFLLVAYGTWLFVKTNYREAG